MKQIDIIKELEESILACLFIETSEKKEIYKKIFLLLVSTDFKYYQSFFRELINQFNQIKTIDPILLIQENIKNAAIIADLMNLKYGIEDISLLDNRIKELKKISISTKARLAKDFDELKDIVFSADEFYKKLTPNTVIVNLENILPIVEKNYDKRLEKSISTGYLNLDQYYLIPKKQLTVLTGTPGSGKSTLIDNIMVNIVQQSNWRIVYFSPENPIEEHLERLIEIYSGFSFFESINAQRLPKDNLKTCIDWINNNFIFLNPDFKDKQLNTILDFINNLPNIDGLIIDPWNEFAWSCPSNMTETQWIGQALMQIKEIAIKKDIHVWVVAHPFKLQKNDQGDYPVPTPYDISGSANWYNKPDFCLSLYRKSNTLEIHIQKVRFKKYGQRGMTTFNFNYDLNRLEEID